MSKSNKGVDMMTNKQIEQVLALHKIPCRIEGDKIWGDICWSDGPMEWIEMTGWTHKQLAIWLGY